MKTTALVVDDSRAMRLILRHILTGIGFEVAEAAHGRDALTYLEGHLDTELALIDWNMPEMNGLELVQAVRQNDRLRNLRMMMVTTETEMANVTRAMEAGADEYIMKPFSKEIVLEKLQLLGLPR
jgi:two-component system chemotaxis response regulator CheY